jgi:GTPase SAR1 family protein
MLGDSGVGKSSIINRYCGSNWEPKYTPTIGINIDLQYQGLDFKSKAI